MSKKIYDLPFLMRSLKSDFACNDGELENIEGEAIIESPGEEEIISDEEWKPLDFINNYRPDFPSPPDVRFALVRGVLPGWHFSTDTFPLKRVSWNFSSIEDGGKIAKRVLKEFEEEALSHNLLTRPALLLAVWKLKDGERVSPSIPVMVIPNSSRPIVATDDHLDAEELDLKISAALGKIYWKISLPESLRDWIGKIESLEIMVSHPLALYDPDKDPEFGKRLSCESFSLSLDLEGETSSERSVCTEILSSGWRAGLSTVKDKMVTNLDQFFTIASIPFEDVSPVTEFHPLDFNYCTLAEAYLSEPWHPDYAMISFRESAGALKFKGKTIAWGPILSAPLPADLERAMANPGSNVFPRWIFHPDPEAKEYPYTDLSGKIHRLKLRPHPSLYGSYFFRGFMPVEEDDELASGPVEVPMLKSLPDYLWISGKGEFPVFKDEGLQSPECGEIIGLCRAFRNSGLVATTVPTLYLFTREGVFLFKETSSGILEDAGLIVRYVPEDISAIRIYPKGICFMNDKGYEVSITGTTVKVFREGVAGGKSAVKYAKIISCGRPVKVTTRPLKLSGASLIKILSRVAVRGSFDPGDLSFKVFGSRDMNHWFELARRHSGAVSLPPVAGCRFYKLEILLEGQEGNALEEIS